MARDANNDDLLRLILALAVIFGHADALNPRPGYVDPVRWLTGFDYSAGVAVKAFFFLSGLFVTDSIVTTRSAIRFAVMRASRLFPGLLVCLVVSTCVVGLLFTELPMSEYLRHPLTLSYTVSNLTLTDLQWRLPGVFTDSRFGLNGSLWTIPIELRLYIVVLTLHLLGAFDRRSSASLAVAIAGYVVLTHPDLLFNDQQAQPLALCFLVGMAAAIHQRHLPMRGIVALLAWLCAAAAWPSAWSLPVFYGAVFYSLLYLFQLPNLLRARPPGDFSYGVYLYGFVAQQAFASLFPAAHPLANAVVCMPLAVAIAIPSWFLIERPALSAARRLLGAADLSQIEAPPARAVAAWVGAAALAVLLPRALPLLPDRDPASPDLSVLSYGPAATTHGAGFNIQPDGSSAIWVKMSRAMAPDAEIRLGANRLVSVTAGDLVTAKVPGRIFAAPATLDLRVVEKVRGHMFATAAVPWEVR